MKIIKIFKNKYVWVEKLRRTFLYMLYAVLTIVVFSSLHSFVLLFLGNDFLYLNFDTILKKNLRIYESVVELAFYLLLFAPLVEEFIFRFHLKSFEEHSYKSAFVILLFLLQLFTGSSILFYVLCLYGILLLSLRHVSITYFGNNSGLFKINIIISILFFCFAHIDNIEVFEIEYWPLYLHYLFHMIVIGFCLSKIRIKLGIFYSIFSHFIFNLISFTTML